MRLVTSTNQEILEVLRESLAKARRAIFATAFASSSGADLLHAALSSFLSRGGSLEFYATLDGGAFTEPRFCRMLLDLEDEHPGRVEVHLFPDATSFFHAKVFLFQDDGGDWSGVVGSANLTARALQGGNFEVAAVGQPIPFAEVQRFQAELSDMRAAALFHRLTRESLERMLGVFQAAKDGAEESAEQREQARRAARNRRALVDEVLESAPTMPLPPLPALSLSPAGYVEAVCATGVGVATDDDLADLSVALNFAPFIRAGILAKESTRTIGFVSERTRKGHSFSLIDEIVRTKVKKARDGIGKLIGFRAIDFGYLRWVPHVLFADALAEIAAKREVEIARRAVNPHNPELVAYVAKMRKGFRGNLVKVVDRLRIEPRGDWAEDAFQRFAIPASASNKKVREIIVAHIVESHRDRLSEALVRSQLARLSFAPRRFAFPLSQTAGADDHFGHKHFVANIVFAWTDRMLRRTTEAGGRGRIFDYLDARARLNHGRHERRTADVAALAARWLEPEVTIETAVHQFQEIYGPEPFTWDKGDLLPTLAGALDCNHAHTSQLTPI